jgi:D-arabinose 1-dehydrogenase-like Zn-dependent alcohol dehydrogenase
VPVSRRTSRSRSPTPSRPRPRWSWASGGLGHLALQYARIFGTRTVAVDVEDDKLQLAKDLGADHVIDARGDQQADADALGGVDIAVVVAETRRLEDVNSCFEEVLAGRVPARLVFDLT